MSGLPRTNNDLEHIFGRVRHHHRRGTGRKAAPASLVLRGSAQARCLHSHANQNLLLQLRFRRSPVNYLTDLESQLL